MQHRRDLPQRTFEFARRVVLACRCFQEQPKPNRIVIQQLLKSATSVGANIEEGQGSQSRADFMAKYSIACKEAREAHYWIRLLAVTEPASGTRLDDLCEEANQLVAILTSIVRQKRPPRKRSAG